MTRYKLKLYLKIEQFIAMVFLFVRIKKKNNYIAVIKIDGLGDYVLLRNFFKLLKQTSLSANKKLLLIGNLSWKEFAEAFDQDIFDKFIWVNRAKIWNDKSYRFKNLWEVCFTKFDSLIAPSLSKEFWLHETLVSTIPARCKYGFDGDILNMTKADKVVADCFYNNLLLANESIIFEFLRNREFFSKLLHVDCSMIPFELLPLATKYHKKFSNYIVIFVGGAVAFRKWSISAYFELAIWLKETYNKNIVFCGGVNDNHAYLSTQIENQHGFYNLIGLTSLVELVDILADACLVISNETAAAHLSIALDVNTLVISNGNHLGRFTPYPNEITNKYQVIYPPEIEESIEDFANLIAKYGTGSILDINTIGTEKIKDRIKSILSKVE